MKHHDEQQQQQQSLLIRLFVYIFTLNSYATIIVFLSRFHCLMYEMPHL